MATEVLEGTWEEISEHAKNLVGRRVRLTILDGEALPMPNEKVLEVIHKVAERKKTMGETTGETSVDIIRRGRKGEMFS